MIMFVKSSSLSFYDPANPLPAVSTTAKAVAMEITREMRALPQTNPAASSNYSCCRSTRWQAQVDAVSIIHSVKMRAHPQSAVGLMSMGGKGPEVLSTFTSDFGSILSGLHRTKIHGTSHLSSSIQVAGVSWISSQLSCLGASLTFIYYSWR